MGQVTQAFPHLGLEAVKHKVKTANKHWQRQKWLVIYNAMIEPRPAADIAMHVGVSKGFMRQVIQKYNRCWGNSTLNTWTHVEGVIVI